MFISADYLGIYYGVDDKIARFFVDREPPANNLYWKGKLLYLRPDPGFLFIPLIVDLLYKAGIDREQLLSEEFVTAMEQIGDISALEETRKISHKEAIKQCAELVKNRCKIVGWFNNLSDYFNNITSSYFSQLATPFKALHRGDYFLFSICSLQFPPFYPQQILEQWFALISTLLLLDDAEDIKTDQETGDDNAFLESGLHADGLQKIAALADKSIHTISSLNPTMARELQRQFNEVFEKLKVSLA